MSSSPSRALLPRAAAEDAPPPAEPFPYAAIPEGAAGTAARGALPGGGSAESVAAQAAREKQAYLAGVADVKKETQKNFEEQLGRERAALADALAGFTRDRAAYFQKVEAEVVALALAVARKILHREAQVDPLLLAGIVRVALEQIDGATGVVLRIHPANAADWRPYLMTHLEPGDLPQIVEDPAQPLDRCTLETAMGTATLGLEVQFKEIEQGLMDLLAARPGADS